jgi:hypothetical protein
MDPQRRRTEGCSKMLYCKMDWWWSFELLSSKALSFVMGPYFVAVDGALFLVAKLLYIAMDLDHAIRNDDVFCYGVINLYIMGVVMHDFSSWALWWCLSFRIVVYYNFSLFGKNHSWHVWITQIDGFWFSHHRSIKNEYDRLLPLYPHASHMGHFSNCLKYNG